MGCFFYFCSMYTVGNLASNAYPRLKDQLTACARSFSYALILDGNSGHFPDSQSLRQYDLIAGFSNSTRPADFLLEFDDLKTVTNHQNTWYLGYLSYDLKNVIEDLHSQNRDELNWPPLLFFQPEWLFLLKNEQLQILSSNPSITLSQALKLLQTRTVGEAAPLPVLNASMTKQDYLDRVQAIQRHIHRGDLYEVNYCMEFNACTPVDPYQLYLQLSNRTPAPFASFLKCKERYLLSASPERFLQKIDTRLLSQPIKGTAPRSDDPAIDLQNRENLKNSLKERTENIMITDLVRNDLSRIAQPGSVWVEELCGIYDYPHVFQMISTIQAEVGSVNFQEIVRATFPMGSMTGAPKIAAMQLIEKFETTKRGLYSGSVGYLAPGMDFDFNVVIRSLQYHAHSHYLSYMVGSAITALANAEDEYHECMLKAYAIPTTDNS